MQIDFTPLTHPMSRDDIRQFREHMLQNDDASHAWIVDRGVSNENWRLVRSTALMLFVFSLLVAFALEYGESVGSFALLVGLAAMTAGIFFLDFYSRRIKRNKVWENYARLRKFAEINGFLMFGRLDDEMYPGMLASSSGGGNYLYEVIRAQDRPRVEWGNTVPYATTSSMDYLGGSYGYIAIELASHLPHMVLDSRKNNAKGFVRETSNLPIGINPNQRLELEGDFNEYFTLYAPKEYEQDALYIFTPDFMALLIDEVADYDVEIIDNYLFVYRSAPFTQYTPELVEKILAIIANVGSKTLVRTGRYRDDKVLPEEATVPIAQKGKRLRQRSFAEGLLIFGASVFIIIMVAAMIAAVVEQGL